MNNLANKGLYIKIMGDVPLGGGCHVTHLMAALQDKLCLMVHHLRVFKKALYLALLRLMDYREQQRSRFVWVYSLQKLMQKLEFRLKLEMVNVCLHFRINCIRAYGDSVSVQLFINYTLNTIAQTMITCFEIEHAQSKEHMVLVVVNRHGQ